ncbi:MAG: hypothetical protein QOF76_1098 [Solirubrobacteraceae bacterium]|jgi:hypothetical protein|nr:hypothetical protein [Solirubrobacteraceae bacterium]
MTNERSSAYGRVMKTLNDLGPSKLHEAEANIVRDAADTLLFASATSDPEVAETVTIVDRLMADLAASGRWTEESARRLSDDVAGCGPALVVA